MGLTQTELAEILEISQQLIACWERNSNYPTSEMLPDLSKALGISVEEILGLSAVRHVKKGPQSQLEQSFAELAKLPKRKQSKVLAVIDTMLAVS